MLAVVRRPVGPDATSEDVEADLASAGAALLVETVDRLAEGNVHEQPQDNLSATYAPRITREDGAIAWTDTAVQIHNRVRGLYPWPHAYTYLEGRRLIVLRTTAGAAAEPASAPGTILSSGGDAIVVQTGGGWLAITALQPEGKRAMSAREFVAGRPLRAGARFTTT
jgi:methionyl-tRNA formyltransferase